MLSVYGLMNNAGSESLFSLVAVCRSIDHTGSTAPGQGNVLLLWFLSTWCVGGFSAANSFC